MRNIFTIALALLLTGTGSLWAQKKEVKKDTKESGRQVRPSVPSSLYSGLSFRSVGPAWASGRIADLAVDPCNHSEIYTGVASGNIWKNINNGTTITISVTISNLCATKKRRSLISPGISSR